MSDEIKYDGKTDWEKLKESNTLFTDSMFDSHLQSAGFYKRDQINNYSGMYRFNKINP